MSRGAFESRRVADPGAGRVAVGGSSTAGVSNRALRQLIARGAGASTRPIPGVSLALYRAWVDKGSGNAEWDSTVGSKKWRRRAKSGGGYEYSYSVTSGSMDVEYEADWKTSEQWDDLRIPIPTDAPEVEEEALPESGPAGWDLQTLFGQIANQGLEGVCNALTAAYLAGMVAPQAGRIGVGAENFRQVVLLKGLLDEVVGHFHSGDDSSDVTAAFLAWARSEGMDGTWLATLTPSKMEGAFDEFKRFFRDFDPSAGRRSGTAEGRYEDLTAEYLYTVIDDVLEPFFSMNRPFEGLIVIKADTLEDDTDDPDDDGGTAGHEFAIRYDPEGHTFSVYDQTSGLAESGIYDQEQIAEILSTYLYDTYITHPMRPAGPDAPPVNNGSFTIQILP